MYGVDGDICPPFQGNPWTKAEDPIGPLWAVCVKEVGTVGTLGILVTIPLEAPTRLWEPMVEPLGSLELRA